MQDLETYPIPGDQDWSILDTWHQCSVARRSRSELHRIVQQLESIPGGRFYYTYNGNFWFEFQEDYVWFILNYG